MDQVIDCAPVEVCECGAAVVTVADEPIRHQVFDVARYVATSLVGEQFTGILVSDHYAVTTAWMPTKATGVLGSFAT